MIRTIRNTYAALAAPNEPKPNHRRCTVEGSGTG